MEDFTPVELLPTKRFGPRSVHNVIRGDDGNICKCQRGAPVFHRSGVFTLVCFDPDAIEEG